MVTVKPDPKVRRDGLCVVCREPISPELSVRYAGVTAALDPFCSIACCKRWHQKDIDVREAS